MTKNRKSGRSWHAKVEARRITIFSCRCTCMPSVSKCLSQIKTFAHVPLVACILKKREVCYQNYFPFQYKNEFGFHLKSTGGFLLSACCSFFQRNFVITTVAAGNANTVVMWAARKVKPYIIAMTSFFVFRHF